MSGDTSESNVCRSIGDQQARVKFCREYSTCGIVKRIQVWIVNIVALPHDRFKTLILNLRTEWIHTGSKNIYNIWIFMTLVATIICLLDCPRDVHIYK